MAKTHICVNQIALSNPTKLVCAILRLLIKCRTISFAVKYLYLTIKHTHTCLLKKKFLPKFKIVPARSTYPTYKLSMFMERLFAILPRGMTATSSFGMFKSFADTKTNKTRGEEIFASKHDICSC